jgi:hypothetical protein
LKKREVFTVHIHNWPFLLLCSLAGLAMVAGSLILLWNRRITFDSQSPNPSVLDLGKIRLSTHYPVLLMFAVGALLLAYPVFSSATSCIDPPFHNKMPLRMVKLKGKIIKEGGADVKVYAAVDEQEAEAGDDIDLEVPFLDDRRYIVRYVNPLTGGVIGSEEFRLAKDEDERILRGIRSQVEANAQAVPAAEPQVEQKELADEFKN